MQSAMKWHEKAAASGYYHALKALAFYYSCGKDPSYWDGEKAVAYAEKTLRNSEWEEERIMRDHEFLSILAASYARNGQFELAIKIQMKAINSVSDNEIRDNYRKRRELYKQGKTWPEGE
jgi:tetratricopeptide (TPR) repeat protein